MTTTPRYDIRRSIAGKNLGLDGNEDSTGNYMPYLEGDDLLGMRIFKPGNALLLRADPFSKFCL